MTRRCFVHRFEPRLLNDARNVARMNLHKVFTGHPRSVGETYFEHMGVASRCGASMVVAGLACLVHAVLPFLFVRTASNCLTRLYQRMVAQRSRLPPAPAVAGGLGVPSPR